METVSCHYGLSVNGAKGSKMVAQALSMGKEPDTIPPTPITDADIAHTIENLKKLNFEALEHPLYSLDLTPSDSPVWSTALVFLNMRHTVWLIIDSLSYVRTYIHTYTEASFLCVTVYLQGSTLKTGHSVFVRNIVLLPTRLHGVILLLVLYGSLVLVLLQDRNTVYGK
jgi:hypothetical protein